VKAVSVPKLLVSGLIRPVVAGLILFLAAGTFNYWQAWVFLAVYALSMWILDVYLLRTNPVALQRRKHAGPVAEIRMVQKVAIAGWDSSSAAMFVVSALDRRFGWSAVPTGICLAGDVLVAIGLGGTVLAVMQNGFAAATVRVEAGQKLVSAGLYGLVRHPLYAGNVIMMVGIPLALGSYWGFVFVIPGLLMLALRIRDEEKLLKEGLDGYREYTQKVRYRLMPRMW
jgi:protein-S-isoprenylcysteine O-methyltransferase Ste14